jgi:hypothetical protein
MPLEQRLPFVLVRLLVGGLFLNQGYDLRSLGVRNAPERHKLL